MFSQSLTFLSSCRNRIKHDFVKYTRSISRLVRFVVATTFIWTWYSWIRQEPERVEELLGALLLRGVGSGLILKSNDQTENLASNKHSSLSLKSVNYKQKCFIASSLSQLNVTKSFSPPSLFLTIFSNVFLIHKPLSSIIIELCVLITQVIDVYDAHFNLLFQYGLCHT